MNISYKKLSKNTIQRMRKNEKEEMKTKQIKIANVGRNLVPIVVQVQGDTGSKLELVPCLEEDRIDRKCLGREIDNERVEMPLECRSLADLCTRNRRRSEEGGDPGEGKERAVTMRVAFLAWPSHLHLVSHLLLDHAA